MEEGRGHRPAERAPGPPPPWPVLSRRPPQAPGLSSLLPRGAMWALSPLSPQGDTEHELVLSAVYVFWVPARPPTSPSRGLAPRLWDVPRATVGQGAPESGCSHDPGERRSRRAMVRGDRCAPVQAHVLCGGLALWVLGSPVRGWGGSPRKVSTQTCP